MVNKLCFLLLCTIFLASCKGGSSANSPAPNPANTWPPKSAAEFLAYIDNSTFKLEGYNATISFLNGTLTYSGAAGSHHIATVHTFPGTYQTPMACNYSASELLIENFQESGFQFKFNLTSTSNFDPGGITNCKKPVCPTCGYYEWSYVIFLADGCLTLDSHKFCKL